MRKTVNFIRVTTFAAIGMLALAGCASGSGADEQSAQTEDVNDNAGHDHDPDGGAPPEGIASAENPTHPVGSVVILDADHMPGMQGAEATIAGAFDTTVYSVTYTPVDGGEPIVDHKWVVHEELDNPGEPPLEIGDEVVLSADHMAGMAGAQATIDSAIDETAYMIDGTFDGMEVTNHKWVVESEIEPAG